MGAGASQIVRTAVGHRRYARMFAAKGAAMRLLGMLGLIVMLRWWLLAAFIIAVVWLNIWFAKQRHLDADKKRRREQAELIARADQQQAWRLAGDTPAAGTANTRQPCDGERNLLGYARANGKTPSRVRNRSRHHHAYLFAERLQQ
jgi:hypothetical protein